MFYKGAAVESTITSSIFNESNSTTVVSMRGTNTLQLCAFSIGKGSFGYMVGCIEDFLSAYTFCKKSPNTGSAVFIASPVAEFLK